MRGKRVKVQKKNGKGKRKMGETLKERGTRKRENHM